MAKFGIMEESPISRNYRWMRTGSPDLVVPEEAGVERSNQPSTAQAIGSISNAGAEAIIVEAGETPDVQAAEVGKAILVEAAAGSTMQVDKTLL